MGGHRPVRCFRVSPPQGAPPPSPSQGVEAPRVGQTPGASVHPGAQQARGFWCSCSCLSGVGPGRGPSWPVLSVLPTSGRSCAWHSVGACPWHPVGTCPRSSLPHLWVHFCPLCSAWTRPFGGPCPCLGILFRLSGGATPLVVVGGLVCCWSQQLLFWPSSLPMLCPSHFPLPLGSATVAGAAVCRMASNSSPGRSVGSSW